MNVGRGNFPLVALNCLVLVESPTISSPLHKEVYDLGTGECFTDPTLVLSTYETRVVGGYIEVAVETERHAHIEWDNAA